MEGSLHLGRCCNLENKKGESKKIPFQLGSTLVLQSLDNIAHKANTKILGVVPGQFIIIEDPIFAVNDRLSATITGEFNCVYFHEGCAYRFRSRFNRVIIKNVVCIDFPGEVAAQQLRKHPRVCVVLDTDITIGSAKQPVKGDVRDISEGGCCLELPSLIPIVKGTEIHLNFELPDNQKIEGILCAVMNTEYLYAWRRTKVGVSFSGPDRELQKINKFCQMCTYFRV